MPSPKPNSKSSKKNEEAEPNLSNRQKFASLWRVVVLSYRVAPFVLYIQIISSILNSLLPILTTYFAALTTTELVRAFNNQPGAREAVLSYVTLTVGLGLVMTVWLNVSSYLSQVSRYTLESSIENQLIARLLELDFWRYDDKETVNLYDQARKFSDFFAYIFQRFGDIFSAFVGLLSAIIALSFVSWFLAVLLIVASIPGIVVQYRISKARVTNWQVNKSSRRKRYEILYTITNIRMITEIRIYGLVQNLLNSMQKYRDQDEKQNIKIERRFIGQELLATIVEAAAEVGALVYIVLQIVAHNQPIGQFIYVQQLVSRGISTIRTAVQSFVNISEQLANLLGYDEFMSLSVDDKPGKIITANPQEIRVKSVSFAYTNRKKLILNDVSMEIKQGEHIAIVGENGAGKTTLIKLLLGLYRPNRGSILLDGVDLKTFGLASWHAMLGVLTQGSLIFDFATVRENVLYGDAPRPFSKTRYDAALRKAEAANFIKKLPHKDDTMVSTWIEDDSGSAGVELSGGQKQRLALARNFYRDSPIIILDEPTSAIDALAEARIFKQLLEEKTKTVITVSHRLSTVKRADRIYVMKDGQIVEQGRHQDLLAKQGEYYKLFESQL